MSDCDENCGGFLFELTSVFSWPVLGPGVQAWRRKFLGEQRWLCGPEGQSQGRGHSLWICSNLPHLVLTDPCLSRTAESPRLRVSVYLSVCMSVYLYQGWLEARTVCFKVQSHISIPIVAPGPPPPMSPCAPSALPALFLHIMHPVQLPFYCPFYTQQKSRNFRCSSTE